MSPWDLFCYIVAFGAGLVAIVVIALLAISVIMSIGGDA